MLPTLENQTYNNQVILKLAAGMFNAAPGKAVLADLNQMVASGASWDSLATTLGNTEAFKQVFSASLSHDAFAAKWLASMVQGYDAEIAAHLDVQKYMVSQLDSGVSQGVVILKLLIGLNDIATTDATWGDVRQQWGNRAEAASYYSIDNAQTAADFTEMQNTIQGVGSSASSLASVKDRIDQIATTGKFTLSGKVVDGYLDGATVFIDTNNDGIWNEGV